MSLMLRIILRIYLMIAIIKTMMTLEILLRDFNNQLGFDAQITFKNLNWAYTSSAILVLLKYAVKDASSCTEAVSFYMTLSKESVSDWQSLLFNVTNYSEFVMFSYEYWQNIYWIFFTSSIITIIYSAIKIITAKLYIHSLNHDMFTVVVKIDQSLMTNLDEISVINAQQTLFDEITNKYIIWTMTSQIKFFIVIWQCRFTYI